MRILIVKPSSLGDIVHAMTVVSELRKQLPHCTIDWVVGDKFLDIIYKSKIADNILIYERRGGISAIFKLISKIRKKYYDYVFDMQGLARSGIMTFFAKSKNKIGRKDSRELSFLAYTQTVDLPNSPHAIDILKKFLNIINCNNKISGTIPELKNIKSHKFSTFIEQKIATKNFICVFSESRGNKKEWKFFPELIETLLESKKDTSILLLGNKVDNSFPFSNPLFFDIRGKTTISDVVFLIGKSQLNIANDSGPLHISAAQGKNTLGLFTATDPIYSGPYPTHKKSNIAIQLNNSTNEIDTVSNVAMEMLYNFS